MGLISLGLALLCLAPTVPVVESGTVTSDEMIAKSHSNTMTAIQTVDIKTTLNFNWMTNRYPYALCVVTSDQSLPSIELVEVLKEHGFTVLKGTPSMFPVDARAQMRPGTQVVLMNHDGTHAKSSDCCGPIVALSSELKAYSDLNLKRRNERLLLRIRHDLKVLAMQEASKGSVEKAMHELSDIASRENLPKLKDVAGKVYQDRQKVLLELRVTTTSQPGLRSVNVPSNAAGAAVIEIPEVTMQSLRTSVMAPSK